MKLKSVIIAALAASALVPVAASAQDARELQKDRQEIRQDERQGKRQEERQDQHQANRQDVRQEVRQNGQQHREDWRDYRKAHTSEFRRTAYRAPAGYRYRPVAAGNRLAAAYYGRGYWINDFARFRLGRPGIDQRWVRYGNDVVLVNIRNGHVAVSYSGFFL